MPDDTIGRLNSASKYPSIPTYHVIDPSTGKLTEQGPEHSWDGPVTLTEKIDGTNGRIVVMPDGDWYIGSREELLYARGDRIENPALGIVPALLESASKLAPVEDWITVYFLEVYGYRVGPAAKQYTRDAQAVGYRLFDIAHARPTVLDMVRSDIAGWRDRGGQRFLPEVALAALADFQGIPLVPRIAVVQPGDLPTDIESTAHWLDETLPRTQAALDDSAGMKPEGIVLRTENRGTIAKARFADYARTLSGAQTRKARTRG